MPGLYSKTGKKVADMFKKGYVTGDRTVTLKTKTNSGVTYTTTGKLKSGKDQMEGSIKAEYAHPSGFHLDKFQVSSNHQFDADISLNDQAEGVTFTLGVCVQDFKSDGKKEKAEVGIEYQHPLFTTTATIDPSNDMKCYADLMLGYQDLSFGGAFSGQLKDGADGKGREFGVTDYSAAFGYSLGKDASMSLLCKDKFSTLTFGVLHKYSKDMTFAAKVDYDTTKTDNADKVKIVAGGKYQLDPETTFQAMIAQNAALTVSYSQFLRPMVKLTSSAQIDLNFVNNATTGKSESTKFGCVLDLGDL